MPLSTDSLLQALASQLRMLVSNCLEYDLGDKDAGLEIAHRLRVILHQTRSSHSIVHQLGLDASDFISTAKRDSFKMVAIEESGEEEVLTPEFPLTNPVWFSGEQALIYYPRLEAETGNSLPFAVWWEGEVICEHDNRISFTRKRLITDFANKLGGSHLDPELPALLSSIANIDDDVIGWRLTTVDKTTGAEAEVSHTESPYVGSLRQIAHELFISLLQLVPNAFSFQEEYFEKLRFYKQFGHNQHRWRSVLTHEFKVEVLGQIIRVEVPQNDKAIAIGCVHNSDRNTENYLNYDFAIVVECDGTFYGMERGQKVTEYLAYSSNDTFSYLLQSDGNRLSIAYFHLNKCFYTSHYAPTLPLHLMCAMKHPGTQIGRVSTRLLPS
jgi:hypothetical protein